MPDLRKVVKVFLASPGDLREERIAAREIVTEFNQTWSESLSYQIELVGWEDTVSSAGRPQEIINRELDQCELFFGMIWKRWGTPPAKTGPYTSGFEEEFRLSLNKFKREKKPSIRMAFKNVDPELLRDPGDELKKVIRFRENIIESKDVLFENFDDRDQFRNLFRRAISRYIQDLMYVERKHSALESPATSNKRGNQIIQDNKKEANSEERKFLSSVVEKFGSEGEIISSLEIARFRLIAIATRRHGNDELLLGAHDSNLIFRSSQEIRLSNTELFSLVEAGLENIDNNNLTFWNWFKKLDGFKKGFLPLFTFNQNRAVQVGAIKMMALLGQELTLTKDLTREAYLNSWLGSKSDVAVRIAALRYLGSCGIEKDQSHIQAEIDKGDFQTRSAAIESLIALTLRASRDKTLNMLNTFHSEQLNTAMVEGLFAGRMHLSQANLIAGLDNRNQDIRLNCMRVLRDLDKLPAEKAKDFLGDTSAEIRLTGILMHEATGQNFSDTEVREILIKSQKIGAFGTTLNDTPGEIAYDEYKFNRLMKLTDDEINAELERNSPFCEIEYVARLSRSFNNREQEAIHNLLDNFSTYIDARVEKLASSGSEEVARTIRGLKSFLRNKISLLVLKHIAKRMEKKHITVIRSLIIRDFVKWDSELVAYITKHGEWVDVNLLADLLEKPDYSQPLLSRMISDNPTKVTAKAILSLSKGRLAELLTKGFSSELITQIIASSSDKEFSKLSTDIISNLFGSESDAVRKVAAIKFIKSKDKATIKARLHDYLAEETYFYNVAYWLDFGLNAPDALVKRGATQSLNEITQMS